MTLKTLTGPTIQHALADARRLFGDVVLLQSSPGGPGTAASVTVAFDDLPRPSGDAPRAAASPAAPRSAAPAVPAAPVAPRPYGYGAARQVRPAPAEPFSLPAHASPAAPDDDDAFWTTSAPLATPIDGPVAPAAPPTSTASADELAALRARLAELEGQLEEIRAAAPPPAPQRPPFVLVGRAGSGKTTLALRLAGRPELAQAACPAVLVVAPEADRFLDPAPTFWDAGVPVAVVRTADDVAQAMRTFADADLLIVDTPGLPLSPDRAQPAVARLGEVLAPLAAVEVVLVADTTRTPESPAALAALGLRPDGLALTRLDEAACTPGAWTPSAWAAHLDLPVRFESTGADASDVVAATDAAAPRLRGGMQRDGADPVRPAVPEEPAPAPDLSVLVASVGRAAPRPALPLTQQAPPSGAPSPHRDPQPADARWVPLFA